jgi:hypothetical protein
MRDVVIGYALLGFGSVMRWGRTIPSADSAVFPQGEGFPPLDYWYALIDQAQTEAEVDAIVAEARAELQTWKRRADPPPPGETLDDLKRRVLREGDGWRAKEVALAMRVTPTFVRHVRTEAERDPETGRPDRSLAHGLALLSQGCSLRQAAQITGIPKSTLHDAQRAAA